MIAKLRLISGLILTVFVVGHFINHALGIISLRAMNDALKYFIQPWRDPVGEALLIAAILVHVGIAVHSLYRRRSLRMGRSDIAQYVSGFLIPVLLAGHILGTRGLHEVYGVVDGYQFTLFGLWVVSATNGVLNLIALPVVWFHTCLGWHNWLRYKSWYQKLKPWALGFAIILPTLALAGYASASFRVLRLSNSERWVTNLLKRYVDNLDTFAAFIATGKAAIWIGVPSTIALVFLARWIRARANSKNSGNIIKYRDMSLNREAEFPLQPGASLLEQFRVAGIPHASVCGGRGRCSTCRVRVDQGGEHLTSAEPAELKVLERIKATPDIRLACQAIPTAPVSVTALLDPQVGTQNPTTQNRIKSGDEQDIAILFADIREFTKLSETRLPYDTAFLLNRYFASMGRAIEESGGHLDKFIGDGVMALFGVDESLEEGCRKALSAAAKMSEQLEALNLTLKDDLESPLRVGIGIHCGAAIVGNMGYGHATGLTAIGDVVNTASRLESMTKEYGAQLIVSEKAALIAELDLMGVQTRQVNVRGRDEPLSVCIYNSAKELEAVAIG